MWRYTTYLLRVRSLQGNFRPRPWVQYIKAEVWDFLVMTEWTRLISYLLFGLFIMELSLRSMKTNNWSADNLKNVTAMSCTLELYTFRWYLSADTLFDSCQLIITWMSIRMSTIKLNTECLCLGHLASNAWSLQGNNAWSLQENSQSECAYCCSHIIKHVNLMCQDIMFLRQS